jgi:hypothetical protein
MDRRRNPRVTVLLPVRVWGLDSHSLPFTQLVTLKNFSNSGVVVQGLRRQVNPGEILEVKTGDGKAQFRVVWVGRQGSRRDGEVGLQTLPSEPQIWDLALGPKTQFAAAGTAAPS